MTGSRFFTVALATLAVCALTSAPARAQQRASSTFDVGLQVESFEYQEGDFMKESGTQAGIYGAYTGFFGPGVMGHAFLSYVSGDLDYDGGLQGQDAQGQPFVIPATGTTPNSIFNLRFAAGYRLPLGALEVVPYAGFGYRLLSNELTDTMDVEGYGRVEVPCAGYQRDQTYTYLPFGVRAGKTLASGWAVEGSAEYDLFLAGENHSFRDECGMDVTFDQDSGSGYRAALRVVTPPVLGSWRLTFEPYYEHWEVDDSNVVDNFMEPANDATSIGLRIGGRY